jgi:D-sedoheptulose 7-phosphate isomerase
VSQRTVSFDSHRRATATRQDRGTISTPSTVRGRQRGSTEGSRQGVGGIGRRRNEFRRVADSTDDDLFRSVVTGYVASLTDYIGRLDVDALLRIVERLRTARDGGAQVFIAGNGGSAATATHWVNDLGKATQKSGRTRFRVIGLADNISWFSALANDEGYERVFAGPAREPGPAGRRPRGDLGQRQLAQPRPRRRARPRQRDDLDRLPRLRRRPPAELVDEAFWVRTPPGEYGLVESMHSVACDIVTTCLIADRPAEPTSTT